MLRKKKKKIRSTAYDKEKYLTFQCLSVTRETIQFYAYPPIILSLRRIYTICSFFKEVSTETCDEIFYNYIYKSTFVEIVRTTQWTMNVWSRRILSSLPEKINKVISVINPSIAPAFCKTYLETYYALR